MRSGEAFTKKRGLVRRKEASEGGVGGVECSKQGKGRGQHGRMLGELCRGEATVHGRAQWTVRVSLRVEVRVGVWVRGTLL